MNKNYIKCAKDKCKAHANTDAIITTYCDGHQVFAKKEKAKLEGKNVCYKDFKEFNDCEIVVSNPKEACDTCRKHVTDKEKAKKMKMLNLILTSKTNKSNIEIKPVTNLICAGYDKKDYIKCSQSRSVQNIFCNKHQYMTKFTQEDLNNIANKIMKQCSNKKCNRLHKETTRQCLRCITTGKRKDKKRMKNELFRLKKNARAREKRYYKDYRERQITINGKEKINAKNALYAKLRRKTHPEEELRRRDLDRKIPERKMKVTIRSANSKRFPFELTLEQATIFYKGKCVYCGDKYIEGERLMGIDRKVNTIGYIMSNCVSACTQCNYIKWNLSVDVFTKRCLHILQVQAGLPNTQRYDEVFSNHFASEYAIVCNRAKKKNIAITLSEAHVNILSTLPCYICKKPNTYNHINGIDRIDNTKGYTVKNCIPCCGNCNYMKRNYSLFKFVMKIYQCYCYQNGITFDAYSTELIKMKVLECINNAIQMVNDAYEKVGLIRKLTYAKSHTDSMIDQTAENDSYETVSDDEDGSEIVIEKNFAYTTRKNLTNLQKRLLEAKKLNDTSKMQKFQNDIDMFKRENKLNKIK